MSDNLSIAHTQRAAQSSISSFQTLLAIVLAIEAFLALVFLIVPQWILSDGSADILGGGRVFGLLLAAAIAFQLPGWRNPVHNRLGVMIGMLARAIIGLAMIIISGAFLVPGIVVLGLSLALVNAFHSMISSHLMSRP